jgi:hypothetical protein
MNTEKPEGDGLIHGVPNSADNGESLIEDVPFVDLGTVPYDPDHDLGTGLEDDIWKRIRPQRVLADRPHLVTERNSPRGLVPSQYYAEEDVPYTEFLEELDPRNRKDTQFALSAAQDRRFKVFLEEIGKPKNRKMSHAAIAKRCDISLPEFADFWRKSSQTRALAVAADGIVALTHDLVADGRTKSLPCERCDGFGYVPVPEDALVLREDGTPDAGKAEGLRPLGSRWVRDCPGCEGNGRIGVPGDTHARDRVLEMNGFGKKAGGGVTVNLGGLGGMSVEQGMSRLKALDLVVEGSAEEVVDE